MLSNQGPISVVVVDDDRQVCETLTRCLARGGYETARLFDGQAALAFVVDHEPDILLIDQILPGLSGTRVIEKLGERCVPTACILFTGCTDKEIVRNAFKAGASDVLFKPILPELLLQTVDEAITQSKLAEEHSRGLRKLQSALASLTPVTESPEIGVNSTPHNVIRIGGLQVDQDQRQVLSNGKTCDLTSLEYRLLLYLARHTDQIVTHKVLAQAVRGHAQELWEAREFSKQHIRNIRRKIGDSAKNPRYIHTIHGQGYRLGLL